MSSQRSRRGFFTVLTAAATGALALPALAGSASAAETAATAPVVTSPEHPEAQFPSGTPRDSWTEPLNASVECGLHGRTD